MRGAVRVAARLREACTATLRSNLAVRPASRARAVTLRSRSQRTALQASWPSRSITVSHDSPNASAAPTIHAASNSSVAPSRSSPESSHPPMALPTMPPAPSGKLPGCQCSPASAQLAIISARKPAVRTAEFRREPAGSRPVRALAFACSSRTPQNTSITGSR